MWQQSNKMIYELLTRLNISFNLTENQIYDTVGPDEMICMHI